MPRQSDSRATRNLYYTSRDPCSLIFISFSISITCCSSAKASAHGTPNRSALVLTTQRVLPLNSSPDLIQPVVVSTLLEMYDRVVGGIMSRSASNRSVNVSSSGISSSSSVEISESTEYISMDSAYSSRVAAYRYQCSSRPHSPRVRLAFAQRTHPRPRLIRPFSFMGIRVCMEDA